MGLKEDRAEFVRRVWDYLVPTEVRNYDVGLWLPEEQLVQLDSKITRSDLNKIDLGNDHICTTCFAKIHRTLNRIWRRLKPEFAVAVERWLDELDLWDGFDRSKIRVADDQRDVEKVRFDIADVLFASKKEALNLKLESLYVDLKLKRIGMDANKNQGQIIQLVQDYVAARARIDLAMLTIQEIPRGRSVLNRIAQRLSSEHYEASLFLKEVLANSRLWIGKGSGKTYLGADEVPAFYRAEMYDIVSRDLISFNEELSRLETELSREVPPREIVEECSNLLRNATMPTQNVTNNINVTNSQVGLLNTGTLKDIQSMMRR